MIVCLDAHGWRNKIYLFIFYNHKYEVLKFKNLKIKYNNITHYAYLDTVYTVLVHLLAYNEQLIIISIYSSPLPTCTQIN